MQKSYELSHDLSYPDVLMTIDRIDWPLSQAVTAQHGAFFLCLRSTLQIYSGNFV